MQGQGLRLLFFGPVQAERIGGGMDVSYGQAVRPVRRGASWTGAQVLQQLPGGSGKAAACGVHTKMKGRAKTDGGKEAGAMLHSLPRVPVF